MVELDFAEKITLIVNRLDKMNLYFLGIEDHYASDVEKYVAEVDELWEAVKTATLQKIKNSKMDYLEGPAG